MIPKTLHQVFLGFDKPSLEEIPIFHKCRNSTIQFMKNQKDWKLKLWTYDDCIELIKNDFSDYLKLWQDFSQPIMRADFIRYLILWKRGGIYMDLDMIPIKNMNDLLDKNEIFVHWNSDSRKLPYNALMGSKKQNPLFMEIIKHCRESFYSKSRTLPSSWKGRLVFHSTGHYMLQRVLKKNKIVPLDIISIQENNQKKRNQIIQGKNPYVMDYNVSVWFNQ